jgi:hypothetical protein
MRALQCKLPRPRFAFVFPFRGQALTYDYEVALPPSEWTGELRKSVTQLAIRTNCEGDKDTRALLDAWYSVKQREIHSSDRVRKRTCRAGGGKGRCIMGGLSEQSIVAAYLLSVANPPRPFALSPPG